MHPDETIDGKFEFRIHLGGFRVAQVTGSFSVNVKAATPPPNPLTLNPTSGALPDEIEGVAVSDVVAVVSGGTPPYTYDITGLPAGVSAVENDNGDGSFTVALSGSPNTGDAAGSPYTVAVAVTDSAAAATARATRSLNVK
jgi:hypothetical protein